MSHALFTKPACLPRHIRLLCATSLVVALSTIACTRDSTGDDSAPPAAGGRGDLPFDPTQLNVILVTIDTLRADRLGSYGSAVRTPHLDRVADEGVLFTNASTTVPFTLPAHSSMMTGTYPPFHGVRENVGYYLSEATPTLAERFRKSGRDTAGFVSAFVLDARWGIGRGFGHYHDDFDLAAFETANLGSVQRPGAETIEAAFEWLDARGRGGQPDAAPPFFLWLHLFDPHDPYTPPEPWASQYPGAPYDAEVAYTDDLFGTFRAGLEARGLLERSALVVTADHGEGLGDHGEAFHGYFVYDSTVHVPLMMRLPGGHAGGRRTERAVSHVDLAPTLLELTGLAVDGSLQGRSLLSDLLGTEETSAGAVAETEERGVYAESFYPLLHYGWAPLRSLRTRSHKYIEAPSPELFDLRTDRAEVDNLWTAEPRVGRPLARALRSLATRIEEGAAGGEVPELDEQTLAQLRALGYVAAPGDAETSGYDPDVPRADPKEKAPLHRQLMQAQSLVSREPDQAEQLLTRALAEDPELLDAHQLLGDLALTAARADEAVGHFTRALALDDRNRPSLFGLASARRELGLVDEALLGFRRVLDLAGQDARASLAIADIEVQRGDLLSAEKALERATTPGAPALLSNRLGEVHALAGRPDEARSAFEQALVSNDRLAQPHFNLAVLAEGQGDAPSAIASYEAAIERAPKHYQAQFNLARLVGRLGDAARELQLLEEAIASRPDFAMGHFFLGKRLMDDGSLERAEQVTRQGLELLEDSRLGWFVLADILNRRGRAAEARRAVARGEQVEMDPGVGG